RRLERHPRRGDVLDQRVRRRRGEQEHGRGLSPLRRGQYEADGQRLLAERVSYAQAEQDRDVHQSQLRGWVKRFADDPQHAFPGQGQMKPEQLEIARLRREVTKLKAERDILKKAAAYFAKEST